jgi:hypothetical protein
MRRACIGELIQIDGCEHHWFEDRGPACTALVFIDDAASRLMQILFNATESTFGYFEATSRYIEQHGKPLAFYSDKASICRINKASATGGDGHTQFGRALFELNIDGICANTPAAEGHVERAHYERKLYLLADTPENRRYAGKYLDFYQYPDGKIEIRAAGVSIPHFTYDKLGAIDQGAIVENKRLGHALRISNIAQAERDNRYVAGPSTDHRIDGKKVPRKKLAGTRTQRELNQEDLQKALEVRS